MTETIMEAHDQRYSRQTMLAEIGADGQRRLSQAAVLIVGLGGLGSAAATYLAGAGVGRLGLCDNDTVSLSNLQRQMLYDSRGVGLAKTDEACRRLSAQSPHIRFDLYPQGLTADNADDIIGQYDIVMDCTDNYRTRYIIDDACARCGKPWVYGSIGEFDGQVAIFGAASGVRYSDLYPERGELCALDGQTRGVLGAVPGVVGAIQASEAIKMICRFGTPLYGKLFTINLKSLSTSVFEF